MRRTLTSTRRRIHRAADSSPIEYSIAIGHHGRSWACPERAQNLGLELGGNLDTTPPSTVGRPLASSIQGRQSGQNDRMCNGKRKRWQSSNLAVHRTERHWGIFVSIVQSENVACQSCQNERQCRIAHARMAVHATAYAL